MEQSFWGEMPLAAGQADDPALKTPAAKMIVIVDDSAANLKIYAKLAEAVAPDVQAVTFHDPLQALAWLERNDPYLIITDYKMPRMNGAEFTRRLRALPSGADVPVLVVTAYTDRDFRIEALEAGATDFLLSPVDHAEFQPRVRNLLRLSTHQRLTRRHAQALARELQVAEHRRDQILRDSHAQLSQVIDTVPAMISATDLEGQSIFVNAYQMQVLGPPGARPAQAGLLPASFEERITDQAGRDRIFFTTKTPLHAEDGGTIGILTTSIDITERKQAEGRLVFQAEHDQLTALPNRYYLNHWLAQEVDGEHATRRPFALYYIDLDRFKYVNDGLGHHFGDLLLQAVSLRLQHVVRHCDVVARLGGDEFAILQLGVDSASGAAAFAERINRLLQEPFIIEGREISTSASIGVTIYPSDGETAEELLQNADLAMYRVKARGRNGSQSFTQDMLDQARESIRVRSLLYGALARHELVLHYQPQLDLRSGRVAGVEALIRWAQGAELLGPAAFLQIAEESGIMRPIDEWVLREACRQAQEWRATLPQPLRVSVNLSAQTFRAPDLSALVLGILHETGLPPELLELELTEDVLLDQGHITACEIATLHRHGIRLSIDDFGTGYSSMARLSDLPIDMLKIDRSFVAGLSAPNNRAIVQAVVSLGQALRTEVLAEGVETAEQLEQVRAAGCDLVQGYFICRPASAVALQPYLARLMPGAAPTLCPAGVNGDLCS